MMSPIILRRLLLALLIVTPFVTMAEDNKPNGVPSPEPFTDLNLRLSNRSVIPPDDLIFQTISLTGVSVASPFVAPSPQAVIVEDDQRHRVAILSLNNTKQLTLFLLEPLPLDPKLPMLVQCAKDRGCQNDRTPLTGGLGCLALCLKETLETISSNSTPR